LVTSPGAAPSWADEAFAGQRPIALDQEEAARFLDMLKAVDEGTVSRLKELRAIYAAAPAG
jgi:hypothetical protein